MADVVKTKNVLQLTQTFVDGSTKFFTVDNAKASISAAQIEDLSDYLRDNKIIRSVDGSILYAIIDAKIQACTETSLDIGRRRNKKIPAGLSQRAG